ncbi:hypothetical protein GCM10020358_58470 [Amorphoplanes nipponensis]|uniref:Pilus assembly protein Flp/PilA n=1 Tax=Actinoplanes nipponensis TaxID=135950 RepID=A0A919MK67_9ACTN|nr:hypothetical protein [Actinoplanes nipponensis]GIE52549.1 hypothetical protein Ani05nite_60830 [Actinoplanes nipponensis]
MSHARPADQGATVIEYVLLAGLIVVIVIAAVTLLGGHVTALADTVAAPSGPSAGTAP